MTNILRKAAENLPGRWHKGGLMDNNGNYCAVGHLYQAAGANAECVMDEAKVDINDFQRQWNFLDEVLEEFTNGEFDEVPIFNDHPKTTEEDVVALLEKAAVRWDEQANLTD